MNVLIWIVVSVLGFGAFSSAGASEAVAPADVATAEPMTSTAAAPDERAVSDELELKFAQREALSPCGMVDVSRPRMGTTPSRLSPPAQSWRCLQDAVGVHGAELVALDVGRKTTLHTFYRALPDGDLEIWTQRMPTLPGRKFDSDWTFQVCTPSEHIRTQPCAL